jgi:hypothetical protein
MIRWMNKGNINEISKIKVGMYILIPKKHSGFNEIVNLYERKQNAEVLWSNEIDLKRFNNINY